MSMNKGDTVIINGSIPATVVLVTSQHGSMLLSFDGIVDGHVGMMPVMRSKTGYISLVNGKRFTVEEAEWRNASPPIYPREVCYSNDQICSLDLASRARTVSPR
jgi:hypothetical protein